MDFNVFLTSLIEEHDGGTDRVVNVIPRNSQDSSIHLEQLQVSTSMPRVDPNLPYAERRIHLYYSVQLATGLNAKRG